MKDMLVCSLKGEFALKMMGYWKRMNVTKGGDSNGDDSNGNDFQDRNLS
jgi:hypothetical protein